MIGLRDAVVSVTRCPEHDDYEKIAGTVKKAVDLIGGFEMLVSPGDTVLIKPNLVSAKHYTTGATTNPYIIKALVHLCKENGATNIIVADGAAVGHSAIQVFESAGFKEVLAGSPCTFLDFARDTYQSVANSRGKIFKRIRIPQTFLAANVVINVPVMKTHDVFPLSGGLKNMKGIIHVADKKRFHKWGLAQAIVDLNQIALPELTIIDGTIAMEGDGPVAGDPVGLGLILASTDTVACDTVACEIMGFTVDQVEYIKIAGEESLGCSELETIKVVGEKLKDVRRPFKLNALNTEELKKVGIDVLSCNACSGCSSAVASYFSYLKRKDSLYRLSGHTIAYGQNVALPTAVSGTLVRIGTCTRALGNGQGIYVPGCPPHPQDIDKKLAL